MKKIYEEPMVEFSTIVINDYLMDGGTIGGGSIDIGDGAGQWPGF